MPNPQKRTREFKPKTKTFTGCWTCRGRKVKCDASRPKCQRCKKSNLSCEGYDLKLYWVTDEDTVAPSAIKRQAMTLEGLRLWPFQLDEVDKQLADIDSYEAQNVPFISFRRGGFTVFPTKLHQLTDATPEYPDFNANYTPIGPFASTTSDIDTLPSPSTFDADIDSASGVSDTEDITTIARSTVVTSPTAFSLSLAIFQDPLIDRLMKNYVENIANVLPPLPHPESPYASIYVPNAMVGAANLIFGFGAPVSDLPASNVAVFYALLASSAFQIRGPDSSGDSTFDVIARSFRAKAFSSLQKAFNEPATPTENHTLASSSEVAISHFETIISAMLAFQSMDVMEGSMSEYWIHLEGVARLGKQLRAEGRASPLLDRLITNSSFLSTLANTTSMDLPLIPWSEDEDIDNMDLDYQYSSAGHGLEVTYGITPTLAHLMRLMVLRAQNISYYASNAIPLPLALVSACRKLSDALDQWSLESELLSFLFPSESNTLESSIPFQLAKNHVLAFAYSLRVYYHTRILPCSQSEMAQYVQLVAQQLIVLEDIKAGAGYDTNFAATITWPGFIASCEAESGDAREVWYRWWNRMLKHRIGNITSLWEVVQQAWALKDDEGSTEVPGWMPVLRRTGRRILAI